MLVTVRHCPELKLLSDTASATFGIAQSSIVKPKTSTSVFRDDFDFSQTSPCQLVAMVRKLKHHEQKLLRKVDFVNYPGDDQHRSAAVLRRYSISNPSDYSAYNRLAGKLRHLAHRIALLPPESPFRRSQEGKLLDKLHDMGLLGHGDTGGKLSDVEKKITVSAFCRRRLGVVMTRLRMAETVSAANRFIEQGRR